METNTYMDQAEIRRMVDRKFEIKAAVEAMTREELIIDDRLVRHGGRVFCSGDRELHYVSPTETRHLFESDLVCTMAEVEWPRDDKERRTLVESAKAHFSRKGYFRLVDTSGKGLEYTMDNFQF